MARGKAKPEVKPLNLEGIELDDYNLYTAFISINILLKLFYREVLCNVSIFKDEKIPGKELYIDFFNKLEPVAIMLDEWSKELRDIFKEKYNVTLFEDEED